MFNSDLDALVPMLCVTLTALATMGTEAFRGKNEKLPIGWWGLIGLGGAAISAGLLWDRNAEGFGVIVAESRILVTMDLGFGNIRAYRGRGAGCRRAATRQPGKSGRRGSHGETSRRARGRIADRPTLDHRRGR